MRGGAQGATIARPEICTVRSKHEIYGDERIRSSNNKLKGLRAAPHGPKRWLVTVDDSNPFPSVLLRNMSLNHWFSWRKYVFETYFLFKNQGYGNHFYSKTNGSCTALLGTHGFRARATCLFFLKTKALVSISIEKPMLWIGFSLIFIDSH